jgi:hypothetical protein
MEHQPIEKIGKADEEHKTHKAAGFEERVQV